MHSICRSYLVGGDFRILARRMANGNGHETEICQEGTGEVEHLDVLEEQDGGAEELGHDAWQYKHRCVGSRKCSQDT